MKANKQQITKHIIEQYNAKPCKKLEMANIVFPKWSDLGLLGLMFRQCIKTKEQPEGYIYDENKFQPILRIIGGKLFINNMVDSYCWKFSQLEKAKKAELIGTNSPHGLITLANLLKTISNENEKRLIADLFINIKRDLLLVTLPPEKKKCIEITEEVYASGLTFCVDEWMDVDENGQAEVTYLNIGDFLIVTNNGVYCIRHQEFLETHSMSYTWTA